MNKKLLIPGGLILLGSCGACTWPQSVHESQVNTVTTHPYIPPPQAECTYQPDSPYDTLSVQPDVSKPGLWNVYVGGHTGSIGTVEAQTSSDAISAAFDVEETTCTAIINPSPEVTIPYGG